MKRRGGGFAAGFSLGFGSGMALAAGVLGFLAGCKTWEAVRAFFSGASEAVVEAAPELAEDALSGNWLPAAVGLGVTAIVGGALEVSRRRRKKRLAAERNPG